MSHASTICGGQHDTKYVTFEWLLHAVLVVDRIWGFVVEPARSQHGNAREFLYGNRPPRANFPPEPVTIGEFTGFFAQKAPTVGISPDVNVPPLYPIFVVVFVLISIPY